MRGSWWAASVVVAIILLLPGLAFAGWNIYPSDIPVPAPGHMSFAFDVTSFPVELLSTTPEWCGAVMANYRWQVENSTKPWEVSYANKRIAHLQQALAIASGQAKHVMAQVGPTLTVLLTRGDYGGARRYLDSAVVSTDDPDELRYLAEQYRTLRKATPFQPVRAKTLKRLDIAQAYTSSAGQVRVFGTEPSRSVQPPSPSSTSPTQSNPPAPKKLKLVSALTSDGGAKLKGMYNSSEAGTNPAQSPAATNGTPGTPTSTAKPESGLGYVTSGSPQVVYTGPPVPPTPTYSPGPGFGNYESAPGSVFTEADMRMVEDSKYIVDKYIDAVKDVGEAKAWYEIAGGTIRSVLWDLGMKKAAKKLQDEGLDTPAFAVEHEGLLHFWDAPTQIKTTVQLFTEEIIPGLENAW